MGGNPRGAPRGGGARSWGRDTGGGMRAGCYLRVSTEDQVERYGLAAQRHALETAAAKRRYEIVQWYIDEGISGAVERRPQLERLLTDARARRLDVVLTYDSSRLAPAALGAGVCRWVAEDALSLPGAARRLQVRGVVSPGGHAWRPTTLGRILANPAYKGTAVYNRRRFTPTEGRSPRVTRKPETE